jgi:hypothetical protein
MLRRLVPHAFLCVRCFAVLPVFPRRIRTREGNR